MGPATSRQFLLCIPLAPAQREVLSATVRHQTSISSHYHLTIRFFFFSFSIFHFISPSQRRAQKANEIARLKARKQYPAAARGSGQDELASDNEAGIEELESEDGADSQLEEDRRRTDARQAEHDKGKATKPRYMKMARISVPHNQRNRSFYHNDSRSQPSTSHPHPHLHSHSHGHPHPNVLQSSPRVARPWKVEEIDGDADAEGDPYVEEEQHPHQSVSRAPVRRPWPTGLADLDSPSGRFVIDFYHRSQHI